MMPTISEPRETNDTYARVRAAYVAGAIGQYTFRASLEILGLRGQDVEAEVNLANMEKRACSK